MHWAMEPSAVQQLLPPGLTVDEFDGTAWVSLTPFVMADIRSLDDSPELLAYELAGRWHSLRSEDVSAYVREDGGDEVPHGSVERAALRMLTRAGR